VLGVDDAKTATAATAATSSAAKAACTSSTAGEFGAELQRLRTLRADMLKTGVYTADNDIVAELNRRIQHLQTLTASTV
jgi:hypothetical protein